MGKGSDGVMSPLGLDENKIDTKGRFDSFYKWSKAALDKEFYTAVWHHINISEVTAIMEVLDGLRGRELKVLDAGCGSGRMLGELKKRYSSVVGSDFSSGLLKKAMETGHDDIELVQADVEGLPFEDESFDIVLCIRVIQHMRASQQGAAIKEMARVLKKGGRLILMTYNALTPLAVYKWLNMGPLYKIWPRWPLRDWKWVVDDYSFPWELETMYREASLNVVKIRGAVCGEPEILKFLRISEFLEKRLSFLFTPWLRLCREIDRRLNKTWPVKFFFGRILIEGKKC